VLCKTVGPEGAAFECRYGKNVEGNSHTTGDLIERVKKNQTTKTRMVRSAGYKCQACHGCTEKESALRRRRSKEQERMKH